MGCVIGVRKLSVVATLKPIEARKCKWLVGQSKGCIKHCRLSKLKNNPGYFLRLNCAAKSFVAIQLINYTTITFNTLVREQCNLKWCSKYCTSS